MDHVDYFKECIQIAAEECGTTLTDEQADYIAGAIEGARENMSMAFGYDVVDINFHASRQREIDNANARADREREKVHCRQCNGTGRIITRFGTMQSDSECGKCRGEGRHDP